MTSLTTLLLAVLLAAPVAAQLPPPFRLALDSPNPDPGGSSLAHAVADAGDLDGDGVSDLLTGAASEDGGGMAQGGRAYVFSGSDGALLHTLVSPNVVPFGFFGAAVAGPGDVDSDGVPDLLVGAYGEDEGRAYVFSGVDGTLLHTLTSPGPDGSVFGWSVVGVGDVDADGVSDLLIGDWGEDGGAHNAGRAYVFSGASGGVVHTLESPLPERDGYFGFAVAGLGDVDADGVPDLLIGAHNEDAGGEHDAGRAYVFSGATGGRLRTLKSPALTFEGYFGRAVAALPDVEGDGVPDLVVGASFDNQLAGAAYVFSGDTGTALHTLLPPSPQPLSLFSEDVAGVGDVDGDGVSDVVVGAWSEDTSSLMDVGRVYVYSGATGAFLYALDSPAAEEDGIFGRALAGVADVGGGVPGLLVGSGEGEGGRVYLAASPVPVGTEPPPAPASAVTVAPNPLRSRATVSFTLAEAAVVHLAVYDGLGRAVVVLVDGRLSAGPHAVGVDARAWPSGGYGWRLAAGARVEAGRMTVLR